MFSKRKIKHFFHLGINKEKKRTNEIDLITNKKGMKPI